MSLTHLEAQRQYPIFYLCFFLCVETCPILAYTAAQQIETEMSHDVSRLLCELITEETGCIAVGTKLVDVLNEVSPCSNSRSIRITACADALSLLDDEGLWITSSACITKSNPMCILVTNPL